MPRVTKSVTGKLNIKRFLKALRGVMALEVDFIKQQNSLILRHYNMLLETEKIKKEVSDHYGFLE